MSFTLITFVENVASSTLNQRIATAFQSDLKKIDVAVEPLNLTLDEYQKRVFKDNDYEITLVEWGFDPTYDISVLFETEAIGSNNIVRYSNDKVDQLFRLFDQEKDAEIRKAHMRSIQKILRDDCPYTFLLNVYSHAALHRSLAGIDIEPYYFFTYFPQWYIHPTFR